MAMIIYVKTELKKVQQQHPTHHRLATMDNFKSLFFVVVVVVSSEQILEVFDLLEIFLVVVVV